MALQRELFLDNNGNGSKGNVRFKTIWTALAYVQPQGMPKKADLLRKENCVARKLRAISQVSDENQRVLKDGDQKLTLEQHEIELIRERIEAFPFWNPVAEDPASEVYDWLNTGKEIDDK